MQAIKDQFASYQPAVDLYFEYINTKRFPNRNYWLHLFNTLATKFKPISFDLIITTDNNALNFMLKYRSLFYPEVPIVFCGLNFYSPKLIEGQKNITGIAEQPNLKATIDLALRLHPATQKLVFIADPTTLSGVFNLKQLNKLLPYLKSHVEVEIWQHFMHKEHVSGVKQLGTDTLIFLIGTPRLPSGEMVSPVQQMRDLYLVSSAPFYSSWNFYLGEGIVGGLLVNGTDQGRAVASLGIKILDGTSVNSIPVITETPASYIFDYHQLERFNIDMKALPAGSIIINKPFSFYKEYKNLVWSVTIIIIILLFFSVFLLINIIRRLHAEKALQNAYNELEQRIEERTKDLKVAKEAADKAKETAELANQAKSTFLATMSHELRTPLNGILGYAQILLRDSSITPQQQHGLNVIDQSGNHLLSLINDVLDLAKVESGKIELYCTMLIFICLYFSVALAKSSVFEQNAKALLFI